MILSLGNLRDQASLAFFVCQKSSKRITIGECFSTETFNPGSEIGLYKVL